MNFLLKSLTTLLDDDSISMAMKKNLFSWLVELMWDYILCVHLHRLKMIMALSLKNLVRFVCKEKLSN